MKRWATKCRSGARTSRLAAALNQVRSSASQPEVAPVVRAAGSDRVVETQIAAASGQGYVLDYVMRQESGGWKVVDVLVDGAISPAWSCSTGVVTSDATAARLNPKASAIEASASRRRARLSGKVIDVSIPCC